MFQSLFSWKYLLGKCNCVLACVGLDVSILVFVEVSLRPVWAQYWSWESRVSILVFVEVSLRPEALSSASKQEIMFQSLFSWKYLLGSTRNAR